MKLLKKYGIALLIGFAIVFLIICAKNIFEQTETVRVFHILCDAFFAAGVFITAAGLLAFSANEGAFDMLAYGLKSFLDMFRSQAEKKYDSFFDYKQSKADKKFEFGFLLIVGIFFLAVSFVMYYFYRQYT